MSSPNGAQKESGKPKASAKERRGRRIRVNCKMFVFGDNDFEAEAAVSDLSAGGCNAASTVEVKIGMELRLSIFMTDQPWPIRIDGAVVRWVSGQSFGLEFFKVTPAVQDRIRQFVRNHKGREA